MANVQIYCDTNIHSHYNIILGIKLLNINITYIDYYCTGSKGIVPGSFSPLRTKEPSLLCVGVLLVVT